MLNVPFSNALQAPEYCSAGATMANRTPNETLDALALQRHIPVLMRAIYCAVGRYSAVRSSAKSSDLLRPGAELLVASGL